MNNVNFELSFLFEIHDKTIPIQEINQGGRRNEFIETEEQIPRQIIQQQPKPNQQTQEIPINKLGFISQTREPPKISIPIEYNKEDDLLHDIQANELQKKIINLELSVLNDII